MRLSALPLLGGLTTCSGCYHGSTFEIYTNAVDDVHVNQIDLAESVRAGEIREVAYVRLFAEEFAAKVEECNGMRPVSVSVLPEDVKPGSYLPQSLAIKHVEAVFPEAIVPSGCDDKFVGTISRELGAYAGGFWVYKNDGSGDKNFYVDVIFAPGF